MARWLALLAVCVAPVCGAADPYSDTLQPDVFGTREQLSRRTPGLHDTQGRRCTLPDEPLILAVAIDLALCKNPVTQAAWAAAHQQAAALGRAESLWLPTVTATGGAERTVGPHEDASGTVTSLDQTTQDAAANLTWTLYDFGARGARIRAERRLLDASAFTVKSTAQQTTLSVVQAYYDVVATDANLVAATTTEATAGHSLEIARALRDHGLESLADVLQTQTAYEQAVLSRVQAEQATHTSRGALAVLMGESADQPLKLAAEPVPAEIPALTARMQDLMNEAARQRPDLAAARSQRDAAIEQVGVARSAGWPTVTLEAGRSTVLQTQVPTQNYSQIGLHFSVPLFSGFSNAYQVRAAQAALESSEANAERIRLNVTADVWNAYYALNSAIEQLETTATLVTTAQNNQDMALGRYQAGLGSTIELLTAQTAAASARQLRITAELNWQVSRAQLAFALGKLTSAEPLDTTNLP